MELMAPQIIALLLTGIAVGICVRPIGRGRVFYHGSGSVLGADIHWR